MTKHKLCKIWGVAFLSVCIFACMLGGFVGIFETVDYSQQQFIADAATTIESYYAPLEDDLNKTGTAFRSELASLITSTHTYLTSYSGLMSVWDDSDVDSNGKLIQFYTGYLVSVPSNYNSGTNREHVWPKNAGNAFDGDAERRVGSDAHHLRPANTNLNSSRGDKNFDEVPTTNSNLVTQSSGSNPCYANSTFFYPGVGYRGATARILMYVQTRWGDEYNLKFVLGDGGNKLIGDIESLMQWHIQEPPTDEEIKRNNEIAKVQGNRNPFIDHPEYAEMIYCYDGQSYNDELQAVVAQYGSYLDSATDPDVDVEAITLSSSQSTLVVGESVVLSASISPSNAAKEITWTSSNPSVATVNNGKVTALSAGTTTITATSVKTPSVKATATINVKALSAINITGTATTTAYTAGEKFNPAGLTVTATYSDLSTATIPNTQVQWLDGSTRQSTLSVGTTSIIAKYGSIEKTISGITVKAPSNTIFTFGDNGAAKHEDGNSFTSKTYTQGSYSLSITNASSVYDGAFDAMGNSALKVGTSTKTGSFSFTVPNNVTSVVIYVAQYKANATSITVNGTTHSITTSSNSGEYTPITVDTSANKTVNFATTSGGKRCMIDKIEFIVAADDSCNHISSDWIVDSPSTCKVQGTHHKECTLCGETLATEALPLASHNYGDWTSNGDGTHTRICSNDANHKETNNCSGGVATCESAGKCTVCDAEYISAKGHKYPENWTDNGENHIKVCQNDANHVLSESHTYTNACDTTCNICGGTRTTAGHNYDNDCDATCNICGAGRNVTHIDENPSDNKCDICGTAIIPPCAEHTYTDECDDMCDVCSFVRDNVPHKFASDCDTICDCGESRITTTSHTWTNACDAECDLCGATRTPADHVYDNGCDTTCNVCGATRTTAGHVDLSPSDEVCDNCGESMHTHNYTSVVTPPTCEDGGYTTYTCACGNTYVGNETPASGHKFSDWTPDGKGKETRTCSICNTSEEQNDADFDGAKAFKDAVEAVKNAVTLEEKFNAIKIALAEYNNVPAEYKYSSSCASAYTELMNEIASYNSVVDQINLDSQTATNDAIKLFAGAFSILAFAAYLLLKVLRRG